MLFLLTLSLFLISRRVHTASIIPSLEVTTLSHYDLGSKIGYEFRDQINTAVAGSTFFKDKILPYNMTEEGAVVYQKLLEGVQTRLPQYLDELKGMAAGSGMDFSVLFLWNIQSELELLLSSSSTPESACSDVYLVNGTPGTIMGHNEDNFPYFMNASYLINAEIVDPDGPQKPLEKFTAFCYAGIICGDTFSYSSLGEVIITQNAVFPRKVNLDNTARNFINRAVISLSYDAIPNFLRSMPCSAGFSLNIGDLRTQKVSNIEVSPEGMVQTEFVNGTGYHFNMYLHSKVDDRGDTSSEHRLERVKSLPPPKDARDILNILGDTEDKEFPIFRTASTTDPYDTIATGLFDLSNKKMYIYRGNPSKGTPIITMSMEK